MIGSKYELNKKIGKGGCGAVFKGRIQSTSKSIMSRNAKKESLHLIIIIRSNNNHGGYLSISQVKSHVICYKFNPLIG